MENFFYEDKFISDLTELLYELDLTEEDTSDIEKLPDDWAIEVMDTILEPMFKITPDWIIENMPDDRSSEDGDEVDRLYEKLKKNQELLDKLNELIPELYYPTDKSFTITKQDLIDFVK